jgi:Zn-dependent M28 family amino/carboxypeptidase
MLRKLAVTAGAAALLAAGLPAAANAASPACDARVNNTFDKLLECVTLDGVREHQAALQAIADANGGTRVAGTPGYQASVDYVAAQLTKAGYAVTLQEFPFLYQPPATLRQIAPTAATYETGAFTGTGNGNVTGAVTPVDINLAPPRPSTSGCEATDFAGFPAGTVALLQRGTCSFAVKALNAQAAGASAAIIFNQGNTPDREPLIIGTLAPSTASIPVVGASFATGAALAAPGSIAQVIAPPPESRPQLNVLAQTSGGDPSNVVMVGAHLDSVAAGPGIQDNGSGSAAILEVAEQMAKVKPRNTVRFAWWGAEEAGLVGSTYYVNQLTLEQRQQIALYLNFDMIGSPNHVFFIYDGNDSDGVGAGPGPEGSAQIEQVFERYYTTRSLPFKGTDFSGRSDYGPFIAAGIPAGGLFTGAEGIKTVQEAQLWGGTAGQAYDPCYHLACDTFANINLGALDVNSDGVAYSTLQFAMSTEAVNGLRGKGNFRVGGPVSAPLASTGSQGGLHDHEHEAAAS